MFLGLPRCASSNRSSLYGITQPACRDHSVGRANHCSGIRCYSTGLSGYRRCLRDYWSCHAAVSDVFTALLDGSTEIGDACAGNVVAFGSIGGACGVIGSLLASVAAADSAG